MVVCKYKRSVSKDNGPYKEVGEKEFKTTSEHEAYKVIQTWNRRGNLSKSFHWRYDFISCRNATDREFNIMRLFTQSDC